MGGQTLFSNQCTFCCYGNKSRASALKQSRLSLQAMALFNDKCICLFDQSLIHSSEVVDFNAFI